jgi:hypothetical protein
MIEFSDYDVNMLLYSPYVIGSWGKYKYGEKNGRCKQRPEPNFQT